MGSNLPPEPGPPPRKRPAWHIAALLIAAAIGLLIGTALAYR